MENSTLFNSGLFIWHQFRTAVASFTLFYKVKNGENPPENQTTPIEQAQQRKNMEGQPMSGWWVRGKEKESIGKQEKHRKGGQKMKM